MSRAEKRALPLIFFMGGISIGAPLARFLILRSQGAYDGGVVTFVQYHTLVILSSIESTAAIIAFTMPSFRFIVDMITDNLISFRCRFSKKKPFRGDLLTSRPQTVGNSWV
jgi:hypothetical protein